MQIDREYNAAGGAPEEVEIDENYTPNLIGSGVETTIGAVEQRLDTTGLVGAFDYPMRLELEARDAPCYVRQGDSAVVLAGTKSRFLANEYRQDITVSGVEEAYFAVQGSDATISGTFTAIRTDKI